MQIKSNLSNEILKILNNQEVSKLPNQIEKFVNLQKKNLVFLKKIKS